jgi:hypothetical protein
MQVDRYALRSVSNFFLWVSWWRLVTISGMARGSSLWTRTN